MAFGNATKGYVKKHSGGGGGGGTSNYNQLSNKPKINGIELSGNKSSSDLGITASVNYTNEEVKIGTFLNKDLYQITLESTFNDGVTSSALNDKILLPFKIPALNIVKYDIIIVTASSPQYKEAITPINQSNGISNAYRANLSYNEQTINLGGFGSNLIYGYKVTIQYTK